MFIRLYADDGTVHTHDKNIETAEIKVQGDLNSAKHWGMQWLSGRVLNSRLRGRGFEPHRNHCVVSLSKNFNPSLIITKPHV